MFYKIRFKIIFVKMGLGSGQQQFGKSNKIVLILMPGFLFTSQFESVFFFFFLANQRTCCRLRVREKKKKTSPAPEGLRVDLLVILYMVNCTVCQDIEKVACEDPRRDYPDSNQHTYLCPKIAP